MFVSFSYLIIFRSMEDEGGETKQFVGGKLLLLIFHYFCVLITIFVRVFDNNPVSLSYVMMMMMMMILVHGD